MNPEYYNIVELFAEAAEHNPEKTAIIHGQAAISFGELQRQINETAAFFQVKGIEKGDRVLVFVPMSIDLYRVVLALFKIGATAVFLDEWVSRKRLEACCKVVPCKAWIGGWKVRLLALISGELRRMPLKLNLSYSKNQYYTPVETLESDTALITFTTGTTGIPKAAKRTHGFLREQFSALMDKIQPTPEDIDLPVLPIVLMINLGVGCTSVIAPYKSSKPQKMQPQKIVGLLKRHRINRMVASPYFVRRVAEEVILRKEQIPDLKKVFTGGAPVFPNEAALYQEAFPGSAVEIVFGSTEAEPISSVSAILLKDQNIAQIGGLPVGFPYRGTKLKIIGLTEEDILCETDNDLNNIELPSGRIGEIIVSGKHVLREYINNEEALRRNKIFIGETCWHRTGDSGFTDESGALFLTGRCNSLIEYQGSLIATFIVENQLQLFHEIEIGTVLKINDKIVCFIELKAGVRPENKLYVRLKELLPFVSEVAEVKRMPRDPRHHSRIDYAQLVKLFG